MSRKRYWATLAILIAVSLLYIDLATPLANAVMHSIGTAMAATGAVAAWAFCLLYSRGAWRSREYGRHMMWSTFTKGLILTYVAGSAMVYGEPQNALREIVRLWVFASVAFIMVWRFRLLWHDLVQRDEIAQRRAAKDLPDVTR